VRSRSALRPTLAAALGLVAAVVVTAAPAWAHVQVSADKAQAGATNVTVSFNGEAESTTAGIKSEQVQTHDDAARPQTMRTHDIPHA